MKLRVFGESHAPEIGVEIEGIPKGTEIDVAALQAFLKRRAPGNGQGGLSTPRREPDEVVFEGGTENGVTTGGTVRAVIRNTNVRPQDYANVTTVPRPGHADYAAWLKTGKIPTGGGKWSGRMTAPLCIAGGIALQMLAKKGVSISSTVRRGAEGEEIPEGDSIGGIVEVVATGFPAGYGDVGEAGLESKLAAAFFGIPAVKGVEFGDGFRLAEAFGSRANDAFVVADGAVALRTNRCGGILGGVSVGMPIVARLAFKPTPSISLEQESVDLGSCRVVQGRLEGSPRPAKIKVAGRHDRCVAFRGAVAAEAAMAVVLETEVFG